MSLQTVFLSAAFSLQYSVQGHVLCEHPSAQEIQACRGMMSHELNSEIVAFLQHFNTCEASGLRGYSNV